MKFNGDLFNQIVKRKVRKPTGGLISMEPDYLGFLGYVHTVVNWVQKAIPEAERVDFLVERKLGITNNLQHFYQNVPAFLESIGRNDLIPLIGEITPGGKDRSPLQAADVFCWHLRRGLENTLIGNDLDRWNKLQRSKKHCLGNFNDDAVRALAKACDGREQSRDQAQE